MTPYAASLHNPSESWRFLDLSVLDDGRAPAPAVPLSLLPQPWRDWIADTERATGAPADYVLQSVLAGVAAVCGAGARVRVTPAWDEPLVLWQAVVGESSTGKVAALAPMRRLLGSLEEEFRLDDEERRVAHQERCRKSGKATAFAPTQLVTTDADPGALAEIVSGNPGGVLLWREGESAWFGGDGKGDARRVPWLAEGLAPWRAAWSAGPVGLAQAGPAARRHPRTSLRALARFPVSVLETIRLEALKASLGARNDSLASRFLFACPGPQPYRALSTVEATADEEIRRRLRAMATLARSVDDPCVLACDAGAVAALDAVLAALHEERRHADGLEAAWIGKGRSQIARLAGCFELMGSVDRKGVRVGAIGRERVEAAATLWRDYYWPHARIVFDGAALSDRRRRERRVARWLRDSAPASVSREDVRRRALSQAATADETQATLERLQIFGYVQPDRAREDRPGRHTTHWVVNPALAQTRKRPAELA